MKKRAYGVIGYFVLLLVFLAASGIGWGLHSQSFAEGTTDLYFKTPGTPQGPPAPSPQETVYSRIGSFDSRLLVWFVTQQHTYFGGFVLALPIFCVLLEFLGLSSKKPALALRFDGLARDLAKVALLALSVTAVVGGLMLGMFLYFYPSFMKYMGGTFKAFMPVYAFVFVGESLLLVTYYYSWNRMAEPASKWGHASIGLLTNIFGTALLLLANAWSAFMMAPAGVDAQGRFLGNGWHLLHSALWNPLNVHRFLADIMSGGAVVLAYACYRFFTSKTEQARAYFDWVGHIFLFVTVCALLPMPFAGYWLMRSVYAFSQSMGVTMMGGLLTWLFVVQALLIGVLFLGVNFYLWQSMARLRGGERYQPYYQLLLTVFMLALFIWLTSRGRQLRSDVGEERRGQHHDSRDHPEFHVLPSSQSNDGRVLGQEREHPHRRAVPPGGAQHYLALSVWVLSAGEAPRRAGVAAGCDHVYSPCGRCGDQSHDAQRGAPPRAGPVGKDFSQRHGRPIRIGCCILLGHGSHGLYPFLRTVGVACE